MIDSIQEQSQCFELEPEQEKRVYSGTALNNRTYNVKREPDGTYSIPLSLKFSADRDYDGEVPRDRVPAHYTKKVQDCLSKANEKMLGPNGEKLKIVVQAPKTQGKDNCDNNDSDIKEIEIGSAKHRSNDGKYESDIDCSTITHEVLHLLGLCDEYQERKSGHYVDTQTGRVVGTTKSVFNADDRINKKFKDKEGYQFKPDFDCRVTTSNSIMADDVERWDNVFKEGKNHSILTPGQFNAILYGACEKKNKRFNQCSHLAYYSLTEKPDCIAEKQKCEKQNILAVGKVRGNKENQGDNEKSFGRVNFQERK